MSKADNKGYTLVELVIVIAIVAILAAMSAVSITLIHSAKAKEASVSFDNQVATLITKSKNTSTQQADKVYAMRVYNDGGILYIQEGLYDTSANKYEFDATDKGKAISSRVDVKYTGVVDVPDASGVPSGTLSTLNAVSLKDAAFPYGICIRYDKTGRCLDGYGEYSFHKKNGNKVGTVWVRKNGSHESR
jgi:prepilin-type N-terminal cleavage/methylation domain-containing protein